MSRKPILTEEVKKGYYDGYKLITGDDSVEPCTDSLNKPFKILSFQRINDPVYISGSTTLKEV